MNECQGSAGDVRNDPIGDALKISSKLNLRYLQVRVDHAVRVRDADAGDSRGRIHLPRARADWSAPPLGPLDDWPDYRVVI